MFEIKCWANRYAGRWVVLHPEWRDGRTPVTEGSLFHCLEFVRNATEGAATCR